MKKHPDIYEDMIIDELSGNISAENHNTLKEWMSASASNAERYTLLRDAWLLVELTRKKDPAKAISRIRGKIRWAKVRRLARRISIAATVALFMALGTFTYKYLKLTENNTGVDIAVITVPTGARTQTVLSDGTLVWLNAGSTLTLDKGFGGKQRKVKLEGEGYFEVAHNSQSPFIVDLNVFSVKVHGTSFNIKSFAKDHENRVALLDGEISIQLPNGREYIMKPKDVAVWDNTHSAITITENNELHAAAWINDILSFQGEDFHDILNCLERKFGVVFRVDNPHVSNKKIVGEFSPEEDLTDIMEVISDIGNFTYTTSGGYITIR